MPLEPRDTDIEIVINIHSEIEEIRTPSVSNVMHFECTLSHQLQHYPNLVGREGVAPLGLELLSYSVFSDEQLLCKGYLVYFTFHCTATLNIPHIFLIGFVI